MKFGKVDGSNGESAAIGSSAIQMGIENAPAKLIVKYITDMYARPLSAAIRETVSNALDASVAVGKGADGVKVSYDKPSCIFSVRDAGAGMDYDKLVNVYTQYGVSDKREDGTSTGAFGLGAKSPLAYTNEFSVITKTERDGCLFLRAYRTPDDDFIADLPVAIPDGGSVTITVYKDAESARSVATPADPEATLSDPASSIYAEQLVVENPFAPTDTGTIVSFKTDCDISTRSEVEKTIETMSALLHYSGDGDIIEADEGSPFAEQGFFCLGEQEISDAEGDELLMRVFACHTLSGLCSDHRLCSFSNLLCGKDIEAESVMFKVGNWLYPSDGSMFSTYSPAPAYIIDVPSKALAFVPSRDAILAGKGDNVGELVSIANEIVAASMSSPGAKEGFINWATSISGTFSASVDSLLRDACLQESLVAGKLVVSYSTEGAGCESYELDPSRLTALGTFALEDLMDSPCCVMGLIDAPKSALRNAGVYAVSDCDASKICSSSANVVDASMNRLYALPGYSIAKSKTVADEVYGLTGDAAAHPAGITYASSQASHDSGKDCNASACPTLTYPVGLAMMNLACRSGQYKNPVASHVMLIDGSVQGVKKVRSSAINIAKNLQAKAAENPDAVVPGSYLYVILPPKSKASNWTEEEKKAIESSISAIARAAGRGYVFVKDADIARLSKKPASASKMESSELEKMVSNARVIEHVVELDDDELVLVDDLGGSMFSRVDKGKLSKEMLANPSSWGIVVVSQREATLEQAWSLARAFYSFDLIPEYIDHVVCICDKNFSKKRAEMCIESGFLVLYDQAEKSGEGFIPSDVASFDESGKVELHMPPTPTARAVLDQGRFAKQSKRFLEIINSALTGRTWGLDGKDAYSDRWVEGFTCGHERFSAPSTFAELDGVPDWKISGIEDVVLDEEHKSAEEKAEAEELDRVCLRLRQCVGIWRYCLSAMALSLDLDQVSDKVIANLPQLAAISGAESCIDSLYAGVPYDDIVA